MDQLIDALWEKKENGSIADMARKLDVHYLTLYRILHRERGIGPGVFEKILATYPDLASLFMPGNLQVDDKISQSS